MSKFNIGDEVKCVNPSAEPFNKPPLGIVGVVTKTTGSGRVEIDYGEYPGEHFMPDCFELTTTPHKWAEVIKAWADGKPIQYFHNFAPICIWQDFPMDGSTPPFNDDRFEWRVKPQTVKKWQWAYDFGYGQWQITGFLSEKEANNRFQEFSPTLQYRKLEFTEIECGT